MTEETKAADGALAGDLVVVEYLNEINRLRGIIAKADHWAEHAMLMRSTQNIELLGILRGKKLTPNDALPD